MQASFSSDVRKAMRILSISPHLDDAALSIGGYLAQLSSAGFEISVLTLFAGKPNPPYSAAAEYCHDLWGLVADPIERRREEDHQAMSHIGAAVIHADFLDAIYRRGVDGDWLIDEQCAPEMYSRDDEPILCAQLDDYLDGALTAVGPDLVLTCAAVGGHVDHRRTRDSVLGVAIRRHVAIRLWTDLPYSAEPIAELARDRKGCEPAWTPLPIPIREADWEAKLAALAEYRSQHSMLWPGVCDFRSLMNEQALRQGEAAGLANQRCELLWEIQ